MDWKQSLDEQSRKRNLSTLFKGLLYLGVAKDVAGEQAQTMEVKAIQDSATQGEYEKRIKWIEQNLNVQAIAKRLPDVRAALVKLRSAYSGDTNAQKALAQTVSRVDQMSDQLTNLIKSRKSINPQIFRKVLKHYRHYKDIAKMYQAKLGKSSKAGGVGQAGRGSRGSRGGQQRLRGRQAVNPRYTAAPSGGAAADPFVTLRNAVSSVIPDSNALMAVSLALKARAAGYIDETDDLVGPRGSAELLSAADPLGNSSGGADGQFSWAACKRHPKLHGSAGARKRPRPRPYICPDGAFLASEPKRFKPSPKVPAYQDLIGQVLDARTTLPANVHIGAAHHASLASRPMITAPPQTPHPAAGGPGMSALFAAASAGPASPALPSSPRILSLTPGASLGLGHGPGASTMFPNGPLAAEIRALEDAHSVRVTRSTLDTRDAIITCCVFAELDHMHVPPLVLHVPLSYPTGTLDYSLGPKFAKMDVLVSIRAAFERMACSEPVNSFSTYVRLWLDAIALILDVTTSASGTAAPAAASGSAPSATVAS